MRLNQILTEDQQQELEMLQEGPLGSLVKAAGRGIGNVVGGVARTAGAVKGAVKGAVDRAKSSFAAGEKGAYSAVSGKPDADTDDADNTGATSTGAPAAAKPAAKPAAKSAASVAPNDQTDGSAATKTPTAKPPAKPVAKSAEKPTVEPIAGTATGDQPTAANDSAYAQTQKAVDRLAPEQKKEIIAMLQADPKVKAEMEKPVAKKPEAKPAAEPANTMANAPVSKVNKAKAGNPNAATPAAKPATTTTTTVQQKSLTPDAFGQMVGGLTKKAG